MIYLNDDEIKKLKWIKANYLHEKDWEEFDFAYYYSQDVEFLLNIIKKLTLGKYYD
jgi:hypothetical protein